MLPIGRDRSTEPPLAPLPAPETAGRAEHGLGRLLDLDAPPSPQAAAPGSRAPQVSWEASARAARDAGDRWFSLSLAVGGAPDDLPPGRVLTAVESVGWRLARLDHVGTPEGPVLCCTFAAADPALGWPDGGPASGRHAFSR